ncbi:MAG: alpha/beta hydrolase [Clostridiales bacterium]|jgi:endo-1,4-beta-xylanase|nr:alpha/beta hydrolase [Clostridiales bacterium]
MNNTEVRLNELYGGAIGKYDCSLTAYVPDAMDGESPDKRRDAVLICPGGGYHMVSRREAEPIALAFASRDVAAFVLRYSVRESSDAVFPVQLLQAAAAADYIKRNAAALRVNPNRVSVCGFSAGAHLAASLGVLYKSKHVKEAFGEFDLRPSKMILGYPVLISDKQIYHGGSFMNVSGGDAAVTEYLSLDKHIDKDTPPSFLFHTSDDTVVDVRNSLLFAAALRKNGVPFELHVYPRGPHGISLATSLTSGSCAEDARIANWICDAAAFLRL